MNPYLIHLINATIESFSRQAGNVMENMQTFSTNMVHNTLGPTPTSYYPFEPSSSGSFKLVHTFGTAHTYNITVSLNLEQCPHTLISYHGNATFCTTMIEMIKPFFPWLPYISKALPCDAHLALEHPRGNGVFCFILFFLSSYLCSTHFLIKYVGCCCHLLVLLLCQWNRHHVKI